MGSAFSSLNRLNLKLSEFLHSPGITILSSCSELQICLSSSLTDRNSCLSGPGSGWSHVCCLGHVLSCPFPVWPPYLLFSVRAWDMDTFQTHDLLLPSWPWVSRELGGNHGYGCDLWKAELDTDSRFRRILDLVSQGVWLLRRGGIVTVGFLVIQNMSAKHPSSFLLKDIW